VKDETVDHPKKGETKKKYDHEDKHSRDESIQRRVIVVHGWDGDISKGWFPWLKENLESEGFDVIMRSMPNPEAPKIEEWVEELKKISGTVDDNTYFIGHSIGCQTILRMLERHKSEKAGGAIFLAGWFKLKEDSFKDDPLSESQSWDIAQPWIDTQIDFDVLQRKLAPRKVVAVFSDNDRYVDISNAEMFKEKLGARIIIDSGKGHFEETDVAEVPLLIQELLRISKEQEDAEQ